MMHKEISHQKNITSTSKNTYLLLLITAIVAITAFFAFGETIVLHCITIVEGQYSQYGNINGVK